VFIKTQWNVFMGKKSIFLAIILLMVRLAVVSAQDSYGRLIQYLAGAGGRFAENETVSITQFTIRAIDLTRLDDKYIYLVAINDKNWSNRLRPFYIETSRPFEFMDLDYPNTVPYHITIQYVGTTEYLLNGVPRETILFRLSRITRGNF
jgi:hypothetical protein